MNNKGSIPTITNESQLVSYLQSWKTAIKRTIRSAPAAPPPFNFKAVQARGAITLSWAKPHQRIGGPVNASVATAQGASQYGVDGYEIVVSQSGDFVSDAYAILISDPNQTSYSFPVPTGPTSYSFKIHTTSGSIGNAHTVKGPDSGAVRVASLDPSDSVTTPTTTRDQYTSDRSRARASRGSYGARYSTY